LEAKNCKCRPLRFFFSGLLTCVCRVGATKSSPRLESYDSFPLSPVHIPDEDDDARESDVNEDLSDDNDDNDDDNNHNFNRHHDDDEDNHHPHVLGLHEDDPLATS
jgi:hypothetical protein